MTEELGKIERPAAEEFKSGRKLYFVPLILSMGEDNLELDLKVGNYWEQVETQLSNLESKLGAISYIFHELVPVGDDEGLKTIETLCKDSLKIVRKRIDQGARLHPIEDGDLLFEFMDWGRCLSIGIQSQRVFTQVYEAYNKAHKLRNESIAKKVDEALGDDETGILIMREGHQVQFPSDIQVFYIAPPGLDELKRWMREREAEAEKENEKSKDSVNEPKG